MDLPTRIVKTSPSDIGKRTEKPVPSNTSKIDSLLPVDTLLKRFMLREIASYEEPVRKGKPRGKLIGLRKEKFVAAVLHGLTNLPLTEIAELADAPYGSLRNWMSDEQFLNVANGEQGSFSVYVVEYLRKRVGEIRKVRDEGGDVYAEIGREPVFNDVRLYREESLDQICSLFFRSYTSASALISCPRDIFKKVARIIFSHIHFVGRIVDRHFLLRVSEFIVQNTRQFRPGGTADQKMKDLVLLYAKLSQEYHAGGK